MGAPRRSKRAVRQVNEAWNWAHWGERTPVVPENPCFLKSLACSSVSHILERLIGQRRESRSLIYSVNFETMHALLAYLTENCCSEEPVSCAPTGVSGCDAAADAGQASQPVRRAGGRR